MKGPKIASGKNDTPHLSIFVSVRLVSFVADNKGIVSRVASMACRCVDFKIVACRSVEFKNSLCRCVEFRYVGPLVWHCVSVYVEQGF